MRHTESKASKVFENVAALGIGVPVVGLLIGGIYSMPAMRVCKGREPWLSVSLSIGLAISVFGLGYVTDTPIYFSVGAWGFSVILLLFARLLHGQLGQPLFRRVNRTLQLTPMGEELFRVTDETLTQLDSVIDRIAGSGRILAVTATSGLASLWLAPRLPRFSRAYPGIDVRVVAGNVRLVLCKRWCAHREALAIEQPFALGDVPSRPNKPNRNLYLVPLEVGLVGAS